MRQPRIDLDRDPSVDTVGGIPLSMQHLAGFADIVGGDGADSRIHVGAAAGQFPDLFVVGVPFRQRVLKDRGVRGDPDNTHRVDQLGQAAGAQPIARQIVQPYRYSRGR